MARSVEEGRFVVPSNWPKWKKLCGAKLRKSERKCTRWAVIGMPTCRHHGSGGDENRKLGQLRYLCWIVVGGPQNMPIELACRVALAVFAEMAWKRDDANPELQFKAAQWITKLLD